MYVLVLYKALCEGLHFSAAGNTAHLVSNGWFENSHRYKTATHLPIRQIFLPGKHLSRYCVIVYIIVYIEHTYINMCVHDLARGAKIRTHRSDK